MGKVIFYVDVGYFFVLINLVFVYSVCVYSGYGVGDGGYVWV